MVGTLVAERGERETQPIAQRGLTGFHREDFDGREFRHHAQEDREELEVPDPSLASEDPGERDRKQRVAEQRDRQGIGRDVTEQLEPDEDHVERERGVVTEARGIADSHAKESGQQPRQPLAQHEPRSHERIEIADERGHISDAEDERHPEQRHVDVRVRRPAADQTRHDGQREQRDPDHANGGNHDAGTQLARRRSRRMSHGLYAAVRVGLDEPGDDHERRDQRGGRAVGIHP